MLGNVVCWVLCPIAFSVGVNQLISGEYTTAVLAIAVGIVSMAAYAARNYDPTKKPVAELIASHAAVLGRRRQQLVTRNDDGQTDTRAWEREKKEYMRLAVEPYVIGLGYRIHQVKEDKVLDAIERIAIDHKPSFAICDEE
jgi:hypothetical protein